MKSTLTLLRHLTESYHPGTGKRHHLTCKVNNKKHDPALVVVLAFETETVHIELPKQLLGADLPTIEEYIRLEYNSYLLERGSRDVDETAA